ncbi:MAG: SpoVR family protein [Firmicutes bacterium]|nr:SpoVR family protein [Bacillota bacterium]
MLNAELQQLEKEITRIRDKASEFGLDFFDMRFEICPAEVLYTFGAYGMPTRFSHWSFGKAYHRLKTQYDYNLSRIYELVINSDPCYAFLLDTNSLIQNKLVAAHVFAHNDFFKNNWRFRNTSRWMVESMASSAERIRRYEIQHGRQTVEAFLDAVMSISEHVDPFGRAKKQPVTEKETLLPVSPYEDLWSIGVKEPEKTATKVKKIPAEPERDLLLFIMEHARDLEDWQRDIISILRDEMLYFRPQMETKIMNEGWATYWHVRIMREIDLSDEEMLEFARMHAGVIHPSRLYINPYLLGLKIFEDIERRWDNPSEEERKKYGRPGGEGRQKIFEVRETETDVSFIRNYLTKELVEELDLYLYKKVGYQWKVVEKDWEKVRDGIAESLTNCGIPYIVVIDGDYNRSGELYLRHEYEGVELDSIHAHKTLEHLYTLWGRPVHLETVFDNRKYLLSYNGKNPFRIAI